VTEKNALYLQDEKRAPTKHTFTKSKKKIIYPSKISNLKVELFGSWNKWEKGLTM